MCWILMTESTHQERNQLFARCLIARTCRDAGGQMEVARLFLDDKNSLGEQNEDHFPSPMRLDWQPSTPLQSHCHGVQRQ